MMDKTDFIKKYKLVLDGIVNEIDGLPMDAAGWSERPGEWSLCQIAHHLEDDGDVWGALIKRAIAVSGARAHFEDYPGNAIWAEKLCFASRPMDLSLARIRSYRDSIVDLLRHAEQGWENALRIIDESGKQVAEMSVRQIVEMLTEHAAEHLETIKRIKEKHPVG